jgi:hypothetical protein
MREEGEPREQPDELKKKIIREKERKREKEKKRRGREGKLREKRERERTYRSEALRKPSETLERWRT